MFNKFILLIVVISFGKVALADDCIKEFNQHTSISGAGQIGEIQSDEDYNKAKWALDYVGRCGSEVDASWTDVVNGNKAKIISNVQNYESKKGERDKGANEELAKEQSIHEKNKKWLQNIESKYGSQTSQSFEKNVTMEKLNEILNDFRDYRDLSQAEGIKDGGDSLFIGLTNPPQKFDVQGDLENYKNSLGGSADAQGENKEHQFKNATYGKMYEFLKIGIPRQIANINDAGKKEDAERLKSEKLAAAKSAEEQKKLNKLAATPECKTAKAKREYCKYRQLAKIFSIKMEQEKEVGRQSGFVNAKKLRDDANAKINFEKWAEKENSKYQQLTGKSPSSSECPLPTEGQFEVRMPSSIVSEVTRSCGINIEEN